MNLTSFLRASREPSVRPLARVERTINGFFSGRVYFQATYWPARLLNPQFSDKLLPGTMVIVVGREGLTLLVDQVPDLAQNTNEQETTNGQGEKVTSQPMPKQPCLAAVGV